MKKMAGLFLLGVAALGLAGCGPKGNGSSGEANTDGKKKAKYDLLVWEDQAKAAGIADAVAQFEKDNNVKVKVTEKAYAGQIEDMHLDGPAGTGADVFTIPGDQVGTAVTEGLIAKLDVDKATQDIYTPAAIESQIVDGKVYGLPKAVETQILYYNKALVTESELPKTVGDWLTYSKAHTTKDSYGLLALWDQIYYAQGVLSPYGGYIFGKDKSGNYDPKDIGLDNAGAIEGENIIKQFYDAKVFPSGIVGEQGINVLDSLFTEGKAAAVISGPWNVDPYKAAGIDYGVAELPLLDNGKHMGSFIGVKSYNVSGYSKNKALAEKFVKFITNEANSKVRYEKTQEVPAVKALAEDEAVKKNAVTVAIATQSQYGELTPGITEMNSVWKPVDAALQTVATGKSEPKVALKEAVAQIKSAIAANAK